MLILSTKLNEVGDCAHVYGNELPKNDKIRYIGHWNMQ